MIWSWFTYPDEAARREYPAIVMPLPSLLDRPRSRRGISWRFGIIERRIDAARDRPTDKFTGSSGGIMRRRRFPTMGELGGAPRRSPFSRIIPTSTSLSWDSAEACAPAPRLLGTPRHREIKVPLLRGLPLYIFRYKFGRGFLVHHGLVLAVPGARSIYGRAWHHPQLTFPANFPCLLLKG